MLNKTKTIAILGSTGSIGTQSLSIIKDHNEVFSVLLLSANSNELLLCNQAKIFRPKYVIINTEKGYRFLKKNLSSSVTQVFFGLNSLCDLLLEKKIDLVVSAIVGSAGLLPTISAIRGGKNIALANKETLVVAGEVIMDLAKKNKVSILPIDSEHSAIFQCLVGENDASIERLIITASGGPFLNLPGAEFKKITVKNALKHPNWNMGKKITIDSATLMNKGLEVIEARWLFNVSAHNIDVVIHPESIVHSLVQFCDGSIKAQLGFPEMCTPILYALSFPNRRPTKLRAFDLGEIKNLNFLKPDLSRFPHLKLAYDCLERGGSAACSLNAANEMAVEAFLNKKISFLNMFKVIEKSLEKSIFVTNPKLEDYLSVDKETRKITTELIYKL